MRHSTPLRPTPIPYDDETAALEASRKHLKPEHIGQFDPGRKGQSQSKGLISGSKGSIYTDPFLFADRLWAVEDTYGFVTLKTLLPILLIGDAAHWWSHELTGTERRRLLAGSVSIFNEAVMARFAPTHQDLQEDWTAAKFTIKDFEDEGSFRGFINRMRSTCKGLGLPDDGEAFVCAIYTKLEPTLQEIVQPPPLGAQLAVFCQRLDLVEPLVRNRITQRKEFAARRNLARDYSDRQRREPRDRDRSRDRNDGRPRRDDRGPERSRPWDRNRRTGDRDRRPGDRNDKIRFQGRKANLAHPGPDTEENENPRPLRTPTNRHPPRHPAPNRRPTPSIPTKKRPISASPKPARSIPTTANAANAPGSSPRAGF
jgi:hypothetical protein